MTKTTQDKKTKRIILDDDHDEEPTTNEKKRKFQQIEQESEEEFDDPIVTRVENKRRKLEKFRESFNKEFDEILSHNGSEGLLPQELEVLRKDGNEGIDAQLKALKCLECSRSIKSDDLLGEFCTGALEQLRDWSDQYAELMFE